MPTQMAAQSPLKTRVFLSLIGALFILPVVAAWLLLGHWRPSGTTNHGELLNPAQPVSYLRLYQVDGREINEAYLQGRWTMIYIGGRLGGGCDKRCRGGLYGIRQVRLALGKDMERAQTLFIMAAKPDSALLTWLQREHAAMSMGLADPETLAFFRQVFPGVANIEDWIYLVDPLGNLLMRYQVDSNPKGMLDDLRHLLKLSKIG